MSLGPRRRRTPAILLGTLLTFWFVLTGSLGVASTAYAVDDPNPVQVDLEALEPALPSRDGTITLRGRATNRSDQPILAAQVVLWRRTAAATTNAELSQLTSLEPSQVRGLQAWGAETSYRRVTTEQKPSWDPGETLTFELSARVEDLGFASARGAYLIGADVVGRPGRSPLTTIGRTRSIIPLDALESAAMAGTNEALSVVVLSSRPSMIRPGLFIDDHLSDELAPTGRLALLLTTALRDDVSWLIDPALLEEVSFMATGYRVEGMAEPDSAGQKHAQRWLAEFGELDRTNGYRVPFGIPDVSMLARSDLAEVMEQAAAAGERVDRVAELPLIAYSAGGLVEVAALPLAEADRPVAVLAANPDARSPLLSALGSAPLVNFSVGTTAGGPGPDPQVSVPQVRQRLLAQSYLAALEEPGATTVRVITSAEAATADPSSNAPWVSRRTLGDLLTQRPAAWSGAMPYGDATRATELTEPQVETLREIALSHASFADMLVDPEPVRAESDAAAARTASSWWRGDRLGFDAFAAPQTDAVQRLWSGQSLTLTAQRSVIMSGQTGSFPMTVTNRLDHNVRVTLAFESDQPQRLSIPPMTDVIIGAQEAVTVNVQPQAVGNGPVRVSALVTTPDGTPVSKRAWLTVEATDLGRVGWIIVVASGVVLLAATALRIRQVRRERQRSGPADPTPPLKLGPTTHETPPVVIIDRSSRGDER